MVKYMIKHIYSNFWTLVLLVSIGCESKTESSSQRGGYLPAETSITSEELIGRDYLIDAQHSYLGFKIKYFGFSPVRGRFNEFDGTLFYEGDSPASLSVSVFIDVSTINTGNETRDNDLIKEGSWFDVATYPFANFQSTELQPLENGGFLLGGVLTIKGISKEVSIEFEPPTGISRDWAMNEQIDFSGKLTLNRQDFGVYGGDFWSTIMEDGLTQLSDEVEIELDLHCRRPVYKARYDSADVTDIDKVILDHIKAKGVVSGLAMIDSMAKAGAITTGKLSTIGYTLQEWEMPDEAQLVFKKKKELYGASAIVFNQLGINRLLKSEFDQAQHYFGQALKEDSLNSRATEYLKLIKHLKK